MFKLNKAKAAVAIGAATIVGAVVSTAMITKKAVTMSRDMSEINNMEDEKRNKNLRFNEAIKERRKDINKLNKEIEELTSTLQKRKAELKSVGECIEGNDGTKLAVLMVAGMQDSITKLTVSMSEMARDVSEIKGASSKVK